MIRNGIVVIERYQKGYLTAYSVDEGKTFHPSVDEALIDLQTKLAEWLKETI